jgi:hypothetical protein
MNRTITAAALCLVLAAAWFPGCATVKCDDCDARHTEPAARRDSGCDAELARLLVKLEKRTRATVAAHYVAADPTHRSWMAEHLLLPAAVADTVFYEVVSDATNDRAWVKMVVEEPRNPHNTGDEVALAMLRQLRKGQEPSAQQVTATACYYAEPITVARTCLACHGQPEGEPDPFFPQYVKNGWTEGEVIGAVVARVASSP